MTLRANVAEMIKRHQHTFIKTALTQGSLGGDQIVVQFN